MCISPRCAEWLRSLGYDAIHIAEQMLTALPDPEVMRKAKVEERILLTVDLDFAQLASASGIRNLPIVVIFRMNDQRPKNICARLSDIMATLKTLHESAVVSVSDTNVRVRQLPVK